MAIAVGIALGVTSPDWAVAMRPLGDGFIKLVKMIIPLVIFCTVVSGISGMSDTKKVGRVEAHILDTIELVDSRVTTMSLDKFVDLCVEGMPQPEDGKRDTRRQNISRAFKGLTKGADAPLSIDHGRVTFCK